MEYKVRMCQQDGEVMARVTMVMPYHHFVQLELSSQPWKWVRNMWHRELICAFGEPLMVEYTCWLPKRSWIRLKKSRSWRMLEVSFRRIKQEDKHNERRSTARRNARAVERRKQ